MVTAYDVAAAVVDPELPMVTIADLGILREVTSDRDTVTVTITPTYTACPALDAIRTDLAMALQAAGWSEVEVVTQLSPPWTTDWITDARRLDVPWIFNNTALHMGSRTQYVIGVEIPEAGTWYLFARTHGSGNSYFRVAVDDRPADSYVGNRPLHWKHNGSFELERSRVPLPHVYNNFRLAIGNLDGDDPGNVIAFTVFGGQINITAYDNELELLSGNMKR
jgi:metal-sulfur cluster biosynthetic enzyme